MSHLVLQHHAEPLKGPCGLCGKPITLPPGVQLCLAERRRPVCSACGRRADPALTALQGLADAAGRVGRIPSHGVCPPLTALLDLAGAAEKFTNSTRPALV